MGLSVFDKPSAITNAAVAPSVAMCDVSDQGRSLQFDLGTVASMKGETHSASLVLESYGGISRKFDVTLGLEYIAGMPSKPLNKLPKTQQAQMRDLYVAMSRPTTLLCLAANASRVPQTIRNALTGKGWQIETVSAFPDMALGSACASSFSRLARRSLALRPAHSPRHRISRHASPKASTASLPPRLLRLLPAGAVAGWGFHPLEKRRLFTAHAMKGHPLAGRSQG
ncbi:hypothetical protein B0G73_102394 [Paraburkholderia sp. BL25I1N1]|nr:hypothetical protein B0G73_102394 [Paraburkholderia sp. BL25I1N1]